MPQIYTAMEHVLRIELLFSLGGQKLENVLHVDVGHTPVLDDIAALGSAVKTWWADNLREYTGDTVTLMGIKFTNMEAQDGFQMEYNVQLPLSGTASASHVLPNNVTIAVRMGTTYRGKGSTGRLFHVGLLDSQVSGNVITDAFSAILKAAYETLIEDLATAGGVFVVVSSWIAGVKRASGLKQPVTSVSLDKTLDSQRRRLPGRGR